ncbi:hypothetical protein [Myroides odoratimimus]|uniref:hypothetical protein n=1 Tax=Myroides odoratimimus TaxID=76832 RepID=UPI001CE1103B|nr:hypothetical protein [Myroides odoratimimus]MCA4805524.1 hypothetical protein [Myroides odoratimimus]
MKKVFVKTLLLVFTSLIISCSSDDNSVPNGNGNEGGENNKKEIVVVKSMVHNYYSPDKKIVSSQNYTFKYDAENRVEKVNYETEYPSGPNETKKFATETIYKYGKQNRLESYKITSNEVYANRDVNLVYDDKGKLTTIKSKSISHNGDTSLSLQYNAKEQVERVELFVDGISRQINKLKYQDNDLVEVIFGTDPDDIWSIEMNYNKEILNPFMNMAVQILFNIYDGSLDEIDEFYKPKYVLSQIIDDGDYPAVFKYELYKDTKFPTKISKYFSEEEFKDKVEDEIIYTYETLTLNK